LFIHPESENQQRERETEIERAAAGKETKEKTAMNTYE